MPDTAHYFKLGSSFQETYRRHYFEMLAKYPDDSDGNADLRPALFAKLGNTLSGYILAMALIETTLRHPGWWVRHTPYRDVATMQELIGRYEGPIRPAFWLLFFSRIEWVIRNMLAVIKPGACDGGLGPYKNVYACFLKAIGRQDLEVLFDVARHLRNSLHNSGHYCAKDRGRAEFDYRGRKVVFEHGTLIKGSTALSFELMEDLISACREIVDTPLISGQTRMPFVLVKSS